MDFMKTVADSVTKAVNFVVDQNRRTAMMNRLKIVIRNEKETQARAYIGLGKYYYEHLRDAENEQTEPLCTTVEKSSERLKRAYAKLDELTVPSGTAEGNGDSQETETGNESTADASGGCCCSECGCTDDAPFEEAEDNLDQASQKTAPEEAADDSEDFLHPFSVIQNDDEVSENPEEESVENEPGSEDPEK